MTYYYRCISINSRVLPFSGEMAPSGLKHRDSVLSALPKRPYILAAGLWLFINVLILAGGFAKIAISPGSPQLLIEY